MSVKDTIPVVYIHKGKVPPYLTNAIEQALNFGNRVVLITDDLSASVNSEIIQYALLSEDEKEFRSCYQHMSSNSFDFEFICIYRWFLLKNFMSMEKLDYVLYLDSDVYLYGNANIIVKHYCFPKIGYNVPASQENYRWAGTASCSVWSTDSINDFCKFVIDYYTTEKLGILEEKWNFHTVNNIPGGICDMTLLYFFSKSPGFVNFGRVHKKCCFDFNNPTPDNYEKNEYETSINHTFGIRTKSIRFIDGLPHCKNLSTGEEVRFFALTEYAKLVFAGQGQSLFTKLKRRLYRIIKKIIFWY